MSEEIKTPKLVAARDTHSAKDIASKAISDNFDMDIYHAMSDRDESLIADEILHGALSDKFIYSFKISGKEVSGISVRGARQLAQKYGGLKHRIIASADKRGKRCKFTSYPSPGCPMQVHYSISEEFSDEPDYYECVVEVMDVKTGNTIQKTRQEKRFEHKQDGTPYERPNYTVIAESKAYRNAILDLLPQEVLLEFLSECKKLGKMDDVTESAIDLKRANCIKFAASHGLAIDRRALAEQNFATLEGLGESVKQGLGVFTEACKSLGLVSPDAVAATPTKAASSVSDEQRRPVEAKVVNKPKVVEKKNDFQFDEATGEILNDGAVEDIEDEYEPEPVPVRPQPTAKPAKKNFDFGDE